MTNDEVTEHYDEAQMLMDQAIEHLSNELGKIRTGKASTAMLKGILVEYYGSPTPLPQVANVATADSKTLTIQPWEKSMLGPIEQAIFASNLGLTPQNDGEIIRINIPPLTEERRKILVKQAKAHAEDAKVGVRQARHKIMDILKKAIKDGYPEDAGKRKEDEVEKMVKHYYEQVDHIVETKEKDILTI